MTLQELIRRFRVQANDRAEPYFWENEDVAGYLNDAEGQACIRGRLLREDATPEVCEIDLAAGRHTYPLHAAVVEITHLRLRPVNGGEARVVHLVSREWLDAEMPEWRDDTYPARFAIQGDTTLRLVGGFEEGDKLVLECYRLPLAPMVDDGDEPEIHAAHHEHLLQWALHSAFSIPDTEAFDPQRAAAAEQQFTAYFGPLPDSDLRRATRTDVTHHNKAMLP